MSLSPLINYLTKPSHLISYKTIEYISLISWFSAKLNIFKQSKKQIKIIYEKYQKPTIWYIEIYDFIYFLGTINKGSEESMWLYKINILNAFKEFSNIQICLHQCPLINNLTKPSHLMSNKIIYFNNAMIFTKTYQQSHLILTFSRS